MKINKVLRFVNNLLTTLTIFGIVGFVMETVTSKPRLAATQIQMKTLQAILAYRRRFGFSPDLTELGALTGKSRTAAKKDVDALAKKGYVSCLSGVIRSITVERKGLLANARRVRS